MQDLNVLEIPVVVLAAVLLLTVVARWTGVAAPMMWLAGGVGLAFVPWTSSVTLPPDVVLLLFLPVLLFWESLTTSLREIRANLRVVVLHAVPLVLATAAAVAVVGHAVGLSWPVAWVLGAVVAPTDATAVTAVARGLPRRQLTTLRAESLINDGTALTVFAIAVAAATGEETFSWASAVGRFALSYLGGTVVGLVVAWVAVHARQRAHDRFVETGLTILTPFVAYLLAELVDASGVLAVVVCGLAMTRAAPRVLAARTRLLTRGFLQVTTFLLNGALFVLVGLQLRGALAGLHTVTLARTVLDAVIVAATVIAVRLAWVNTSPYVIRVLDRRPAQRARRIGFRGRLATGWAGFRGGVSLAAALAVPVTLADGSPFPGRDLIVLVTFGVITVTLVVQGTTLPAVLRFAALPSDTAVTEEEHTARRHALTSALDALDSTVASLRVEPAAGDQVRTELELRLALVDPPPDEPSSDGSPPLAVVAEHAHRLRSALLVEQRAAVVALRDAGTIDDIVLRRIETQLDTEEVKLAGGLEPED